MYLDGFTVFVGWGFTSLLTPYLTFLIVRVGCKNCITYYLTFYLMHLGRVYSVCWFGFYLTLLTPNLLMTLTGLQWIFLLQEFFCIPSHLLFHFAWTGLQCTVCWLSFYLPTHTLSLNDPARFTASTSSLISYLMCLNRRVYSVCWLGFYLPTHN
jgi:hypothetical protein